MGLRGPRSDVAGMKAARAALADDALRARLVALCRREGFEIERGAEGTWKWWAGLASDAAELFDAAWDQADALATAAGVPDDAWARVLGSLNWPGRWIRLPEPSEQEARDGGA